MKLAKNIIKRLARPGCRQCMRIQGIRPKGQRMLYICLSLIIIALSVSALFSFTGCRQYDSKMDIVYFFKTDPEKAVLDFIYAMDNHDPEYIYSSLLPDRDKRNIDKDKFIRGMGEILKDVEDIKINQITYLGYENDMSKVVIDFTVNYKGQTSGDYRKYIYLLSENGKWKIVFDKTFI